MKQQPQNPVTFSGAAKLFNDGLYEEAEQACAALTQTEPGNARLFYLYGLCCYKNDRLADAAAKFRKAVDLNPADNDSLFNLGVALGELRQYGEAISAYKTLIQKAPHYTKALPNLAQALMKTGAYEEGCEKFAQAIAANPDDAATAMLALEYDCLYLPMDRRPNSCNNVLAMNAQTNGGRYTALLYRATAEWVQADLRHLEHTLAAAAEIPSMPHEQGYRNMNIYHTFLTRLLAYRRENESLYEASRNAKPLPLVGDSHSLSYANVPLNRDGTDYCIRSHLLIGTQARHLGKGSSGDHTRRAALTRFLQSLPDASPVLCAFGEIDCRTNYGIMPHVKKHGGDIGACAAEVARDYVEVTAMLAKPRRLSLTFLSVPAPQAASGDRRKVIRIFNRELRTVALEKGHHYADLYTPTLGEGGYGHGRLHIDNHHLLPEAIQPCLKNNE